MMMFVVEMSDARQVVHLGWGGGHHEVADPAFARKFQTTADALEYAFHAQLQERWSLVRVREWIEGRAAVGPAV